MSHDLSPGTKHEPFLRTLTLWLERLTAVVLVLVIASVVWMVCVASPGPGADRATLAGNTCSLVAQAQCRQSMAAGTAPYLIGVAELAATAPRPNALRLSSDEIEAVVVLGLLTVAVALVSAVALLHTRRSGSY